MQRIRSAAAAAAAFMLVSGLVAAPPASAASGWQTYPLPASGTVTVDGHGNGHGHGLSQWGAYGWARAGRTTTEILAFYYPNTVFQPADHTLATIPVRVALSGTGTALTVPVQAGLSATGVGPLPAAGINRYRLVASGSGLALQARRGSTWSVTRSGLPSWVKFTVSGSSITMIDGNGSARRYRGNLVGVRSGSGVTTVNRVALDDYVRGVAPNESPSSWPAAAVRAQVVAARTYALFEVRAEAGGGTYDVCDTSSCQVYGGFDSEAAASNTAVAATDGRILSYLGSPIFAQFSASNGGWTADGGKPYLIARPDPYESAATDPWFNWSRSVPVSAVASYYGLSSVRDIRVLSRSGNGQWGGLVQQAEVDGVAGGRPTSVAVTGASLRSAMGLPLEWFTIGTPLPPVTAPAPSRPPGAPTVLSVVALDRALLVRWGAPVPVPGAAAPTTYSVVADSVVAGSVVAGSQPALVVSGSSRGALITRLTNGLVYRVKVTALSAVGTGGNATLLARPIAVSPQAPAAVLGAALSAAHSGLQLTWQPVTDPSVLVLLVGVNGRTLRVSRHATQLMIGNLSDGVATSVALRAVNRHGGGAPVIVVQKPAPVPGRPTSVRLARVSRGAIVTWRPPVPNGTGPVLSYAVQATGSAHVTVSATTRSRRLAGLTPGRTYAVRVRAVNATGAGPAFIASVVAG
jgi:stage II sporulation protein D